jgi:hypothetical protein
MFKASVPTAAFPRLLIRKVYMLIFPTVGAVVLIIERSSA